MYYLRYLAILFILLLRSQTIVCILYISPVYVPQPRIHFDVPEMSQLFHVKGPIPDENDQSRHLTSGA